MIDSTARSDSNMICNVSLINYPLAKFYDYYVISNIEPLNKSISNIIEKHMILQMLLRSAVLND